VVKGPALMLAMMAPFAGHEQPSRALPGSLGAAGVQFNACSARDCAYSAGWANCLPRRRRMAGRLVAGQSLCKGRPAGLSRATIAPIAHQYPPRQATKVWPVAFSFRLPRARFCWGSKSKCGTPGCRTRAAGNRLVRALGAGGPEITCVTGGVFYTTRVRPGRPERTPQTGSTVAPQISDQRCCIIEIVSVVPDPDSYSAAKDALSLFTQAYRKARCLAATYDPLPRAARK